jgi:iron only hydrogenase large subunit-like protein
MNKAIITTDDNKCAGCNKCIFECPVDANSAKIVNDKNKISVDPDKCIHCGHCIRVCDHGARDYTDDTELFFTRLKQGAKISALVAPAIRSSFSDYKRLIGFLKDAGVNLVFDVSFGADICTWAYLKAVSEENLKSIIAQPCPVIVNYIQKYSPELIPSLAPIHSPAMCSAVFMRDYLGVSDELAFISPCIGKKTEFEDPNTHGYISYNVTVNKLKDYMQNKGYNLSSYPQKDFDECRTHLGFTFSRTGGLRENVEYYTGGKAWVKQVEGTEEVCEYLERYKERLRSGKPLPLLVDALNCRQGCNVGTAMDKKLDTDDMDYKTNLLKQDFLEAQPEPQASRLFRAFDEKLTLSDFYRSYEQQSRDIKAVTEAELEAVYKELGKHDPESRKINCFSCGYGSCRGFAEAVALGGNDVRNCVNYSKIRMKSGREEFDSLFEALGVRITEINDNLGRIKSSSNNLDKITMQTKLISLNASIESARAGQYGRTFSVVAAEIKDLSEKSKTIVASNQEDQQNIVRAIQNFEEEIKNIRVKIDAILR